MIIKGILVIVQGYTKIGLLGHFTEVILGKSGLLLFLFCFVKLPLHRQVQSSGKNNIILKIETICGNVDIAKILKNNNVYILFSSHSSKERLKKEKEGKKIAEAYLNLRQNEEVTSEQTLKQAASTDSLRVLNGRGCVFMDD